MNRKEIEKKIVDIISNISEHKNIEIDEPLVSYGVDSFMFINIIVEIEKKLNIRIEDEYLSFEKFDRISSMVTIVEKIKEISE